MRKLALLSLAVLAIAIPALAQLPPFEAEIDCGDVHQPGDRVPFTLRFENQTFEIQDLDTTVELSIPGIGLRTLFNRTVRLNPNQDRDINRTVNLRPNAPTGSYEMTVTATNGVDSTFDTCSFNVVP